MVEAPQVYASGSVKSRSRRVLCLTVLFVASADAAVADNPLIAAGLEDPGFANAARRDIDVPGVSVPGIYLGNQWFLTARHTSVPIAVALGNEIYDVVPGSEVVLDNPNRLRGVASTDGDPSDLSLFRLRPTEGGLTPELADSSVRTVGNPNPDRRLAIADSTHAPGSDVITIGISAASSVGTDNHFGTNVIVDDSNVERNANGGRFFDSNDDIVLVGLPGGASVPAVIVRTDPAGASESTDFEFQARGGDSGSPVFVRNSAGEFEFGGVLHGLFLDIPQPGPSNTPQPSDPLADFTAFTDIGSPLTTYRQQIESLVLDDNDYSTQGDVNLDGAVDESDLQALAEGWNDAQTDAGVLTWIRGDLNQDGDTDLADFALLRNAPNATFDLADLNTALAVAGVPAVIAVPEPSAALLLICAGGLSALRRRR